MSNPELKVSLVQPRHIYAPAASESAYGHIYLPTSLIAAARLFLELGVEVDLQDENIREARIDEPLIGINLLGAPYLSCVREFKGRVQDVHGPNGRVLIGGQVVNGLSDEESRALFGPSVLRCNRPADIANVAGHEKCPEISELSMVPAFELIPDEDFARYLASEFCFYLAQGCKYSCSFCAAEHNGVFVGGKKVYGISEKYRSMESAAEDLEYLMERASRNGIDKIELYLSNLDLFQSPKELQGFANEVVALRRKMPAMRLRLRGLSTVRSFLNAHEQHGGSIQGIVDAGLYRVGFGIDGATPKVWKETRKPQTATECVSAIKIAREDYGLVPETLMVFGHNQKEDSAALAAAFEFSAQMLEAYGACPRPHVAKDVVPGNDGWNLKANKAVVDRLLKVPRLFQNLDFTCLPSPLTHPDKEFRKSVHDAFVRVCELPGSLTQYVMPELEDMSAGDLEAVRIFNRERYDI